MKKWLLILIIILGASMVSAIDITIITPQNTTYTSYVTVSFNATDDTAVNSLWFYNGTGNTTYTTPINVSLAEGSYTWTFYADDTLGNLAEESKNFDIVFPPFSFNISSIGREWVRAVWT